MEQIETGLEILACTVWNKSESDISSFRDPAATCPLTCRPVSSVSYGWD